MRKNAITLQAFVLLIRNHKIIAEAVFIMDWGPSICCIANRTFPLWVHFRYWFLTHLALIFFLLLNTMRQILCACPISVSEESIQILWKSAVAVLFTIRSRAPSLLEKIIDNVIMAKNEPIFTMYIVHLSLSWFIGYIKW